MSAAAAALATQAIFAQPGFFEQVRSLGAYLEQQVHTLRDEPHVSDIRNLGAVAGLTLSQRDGQPGIRATELFESVYEQGVVIRHNGDTIALSPILTMSHSDIDTIVETLRAGLRSIR